jgi:hypothetical protein
VAALFFDSSALAKLYHPEVGIPEVATLEGFAVLNPEQ